jgi:hypothetical protein
MEYRSSITRRFRRPVKQDLEVLRQVFKNEYLKLSLRYPHEHRREIVRDAMHSVMNICSPHWSDQTWIKFKDEIGMLSRTK